MWLPAINTDSLVYSPVYKDTLDIPDTILFDPHPDIARFEELVTLYSSDKAAAYKQIHSRHQEIAVAMHFHTLHDETFTAAWMIEQDITAINRNSIPTNVISLYTEALLLKLQTLHLEEYPIVLALCFTEPRKEYTYQEFSAAYYLVCLHKGLPGLTSPSRTMDITFFTAERRQAFSRQYPEEPVDDSLVPHTPYIDFGVRMENGVYVYDVGNVSLPFFLHSRFKIELYLLTPLKAKVANKYLRVKNNLLKHHTAEEKAVLNLHQSINQFNLPLILHLRGYEVYPMPDIITHDEELFLQYPLIRR